MSSNNRRSFLQSMAVSGFAAGVGMSHNAYATVDAPIHAANLNPAGDIYIDPRKVLLYECTRREIRERLQSGELKAAIIPTGATEQHNEHMAMIMDTAGSLLISQQVALMLYPQVIVTTPIPIGISPYWMNRKGTLTLRREVFLDVVYDICDSLKTHGIKTILIVNGHGGNAQPISEVLPDFVSKLGIKIESCSYWDSIPKEMTRTFLEQGSVPGHADEMETCIALAAFPERIRYQGVDFDKALASVTDENERKGLMDRGGFEQSKCATPEKGERIIAHATKWVAEKLQGMIG